MAIHGVPLFIDVGDTKQGDLCPQISGSNDFRASRSHLADVLSHRLCVQ